MKTIETMIKSDIEWHKNQNPADHVIGIEYAAGFVAGLQQALKIAGKIPDWEEVTERLMDALTIYGEVLDDMPTAIEDLIGDEGKNTRVDEAFEAYKSAHLQMSNP